MNNRGQVLIFFVLIIPLLILGAAYIVDNIYISYNTNKLNGINNLVIKDASINNMSEGEIREYIKKNDKDIKIEKIIMSNDKLQIKISKEIKSLFGRIIGKNTYNLTSSKEIDIKTNEDIPIYQ